MGCSRTLIGGNKHFCRQIISYQVASCFSSFSTSTRKATGSFIMNKEITTIRGCLVRTELGKFLPLGVRELSHSVDGNLHTKAKEEESNGRKQKEVAQKENSKEEHSPINPLRSSEYYDTRNKWGIEFQNWKGKFTSSVKHYWHGTKLLLTDTRISSKLLLELVNGKELSRREKRQLTCTTSDIVKFVPFVVFVIVPFMEFSIPILLKLFPNMIPSTFKEDMQNKVGLKRNLKARMEYTKFLQETIKGMEKEIRSAKSGTNIEKTAEDLDEFMRKVRTGGCISDLEILCFAKLFVDELILDNLNRIKNDDTLIQQKGIGSLSDYELEQACTYRGNLGSFSRKHMHLKLGDWLDLSLNHAVPISLLVLSRSFAVSDKARSVEVLRGAVSSLPDSVVSTLGTSLPSVSERRRKLEFLEMQEELIKEEERERALAAQKAKEHMRCKMEQKLEFCKISRALSLLASASSVRQERDELLGLFYKEIELYNLMLDKKDSGKSVHEAYNEARGALGYKPSSELAGKVERLLEKLEKEIGDMDAIIGTQQQLLDKDHDGKVTSEELAAAAMYLKENLDTTSVQDIVANLSKDKDGRILIEDIVKLGSKTM